jgi:5-methyltetrahydropteroyltriglutamate--homocysteine methyltransferase
LLISRERILTTHVGSLPRPDSLIDLIRRKEGGELQDTTDFARHVQEAVLETVRLQVESGIDVVSDGEEGRPGYATYVKDRLTGFGGEHRVPVRLSGEARDFPEYTQRRAVHASTILARPACNAPLAWSNFDAVTADLEAVKAAAAKAGALEVFMTSASPGVVPLFLGNDYYESDDAFKVALTDVLQREYEAIAAAGVVLQIDCPDLAMGRHFVDMANAQFRDLVARNIELANHATRNIPPEQMRLHLCWGNYEGPHHLDIPLREILDIVLTARPSGISFEAANPRHAHEWVDWKNVKIPDDKILLPGVIDSTTNFVEHPELVAQRIETYASIVGRERVIASTDCGFGTNAASTLVDSRITWAKLRSLADGAALASQRLY